MTTPKPRKSPKPAKGNGKRSREAPEKRAAEARQTATAGEVPVIPESLRKPRSLTYLDPATIRDAEAVNARPIAEPPNGAGADWDAPQAASACTDFGYPSPIAEHRIDKAAQPSIWARIGGAIRRLFA